MCRSTGHSRPTRLTHVNIVFTATETVCRGGQNSIFRGGRDTRPCLSLLQIEISKSFYRGGLWHNPPLEIGSRLFFKFVSRQFL